MSVTEYLKKIDNDVIRTKIESWIHHKTFDVYFYNINELGSFIEDYFLTANAKGKKVIKFWLKNKLSLKNFNLQEAFLFYKENSVKKEYEPRKIRGMTEDQFKKMKEISKKFGFEMYDYLRNIYYKNRYELFEIGLFNISNFMVNDIKILNKNSKERLTFFVSNHNRLPFDENEMNNFYLKKSKSKMKKATKERSRLFKNKSYRDKFAKNIKNKRINNQKEKIGLGLSDKEYLYESYLDGLETKGLKIAKKIGLEIKYMTRDELINLSGRTKKDNFEKLSDEEKKEKRAEWKRSNLKNENVIKMLKDNDLFMTANINKMSDDEVDVWYSNYISAMTTKNIINHPESLKNGYFGKNAENGFYYSKKNNVKMYYRSSYERKVLEYLDRNRDVGYFDTEPFHIKIDMGNNIFRAYVPDIIFKTKSGNSFLIEVKPKKMVKEFIEKKGKFILSEYDNFYIITEKEVFNEREFCKLFNLHYGGK